MANLQWPENQTKMLHWVPLISEPRGNAVPTLKVNGVELFYQESGRGPETIVFSHGLLMDHTMFEAQRAAFQGRYRVIAYDHRGQGQSGDPGNGRDQDMETLTTDAAALIQALGAAPCHFAGHCMGGFVGMRLASRRPALVRTLTLMNTGAQPKPRLTRIKYGFLARLLRLTGPGPFTGIAMNELFGESVRKDPTQRRMLAEWRSAVRLRPRSVANAVIGVMERREVSTDELRSIRCPTLVIAGEEDTTQVPGNSERMAASIPGAGLVRIPGCGHSSTLEAPQAVVRAMQKLFQAAETAVPSAAG
jgi:3-oxoadipate enol-lactonase